MNYFKTNKLMAYILVPLAFAVLGYGLLYFSAKPILTSTMETWRMVSNDISGQKNGEYKDIFDLSKVSAYTDFIPSSEINFPTLGTRYGEIEIEGTSVKAPLFFGDENNALRNGVGHYSGSEYPGMGSTVLIAGHNNTYFNDLKNAEVGKLITLRTNYGTYTYEIVKTAILKSSDKSAYDLASREENIVLYTCYPFNMLGLTPQRYFVYGKFVSGPKVQLDR